MKIKKAVVQLCGQGNRSVFNQSFSLLIYLMLIVKYQGSVFNFIFLIPFQISYNNRPNHKPLSLLHYMRPIIIKKN